MTSAASSSSKPAGNPSGATGLTLEVNGESFRHNGEASPAGLIRAVGLPPESVAMIVNGEVASRADWPGLRFREGDRIELLVLAGGG